MHLLLGWLGGLIATFAGFLAQWFGRRAAIRLSIITAMLSFLGIFIAAVNAAVSGLSVVLPSAVVIGASWFMPDNINACISACISVRLAKYIYDYQQRVLAWQL